MLCLFALANKSGTLNRKPSIQGLLQLPLPTPMQNNMFTSMLISMRNSYLLIFLLFIICMVGCVPSIKTNHVVFNYDDLGPQVASYELIGYEWYQWNSQGPDNPNERDDVKVVVYRGVTLKQIQQQYPVISGKQDYRYLEYTQALKHLGKFEQALLEAHNAENDSIMKKIRESVKKTRERIFKELGK
jgi:hypothetical protein